MPSTAKRLFIVGAALAAVVFLSGWMRNQLGIDLSVESVRHFAESLGNTGPILFVFVIAGRSLLALPSQIVLIAAGLCFGTLVGTVVGGVGLMMSGLILFLATRYAGRDAIERRIGPRAKRILEFAGRRSGAMTLAVACGYPITPLSPIQAAAGLTPMPVPNFVIAAFVGGSIRSSIFAYFGNSLVNVTLANMLTASGAFLLMLAIPLAFPAGRAWLSEIFVPQTED
ncbi:MAG: VTT domain-containing protein [Myxococcales bacterium]|nr:TVP38/TMEM64 family protein [Myxococcales bacterium]HIK83501.1 TVP38/TMEM64 family protein [Myxococcales bacterium]